MYYFDPLTGNQRNILINKKNYGQQGMRYEETKEKSNEWEKDNENAPDMHNHNTSRQSSISRLV